MCPMLTCAVLHLQGTKGALGQPGPAGEQGMRGPQVSERRQNVHPAAACCCITPSQGLGSEVWWVGVQFPRRDVFGSHLSGAEEFGFSPNLWLCWCVSLPMCVDIFLPSAQGPPGQIGTPGIRGEQGVPGPRVSPSAHSQPGTSRAQPGHPTEFPTVL